LTIERSFYYKEADGNTLKLSSQNQKRSLTAMVERILSPNLAFAGTANLSCRSISRMSLRRAVEQTDWDEKILRQENRLNAWCWAALAAACFCMLPFLLAVLLP